MRGLGGHLRFLGETGSSWSSSLGLILLILKGHTSENKNQNIQRVHGPVPGIQLVLISALNFLYCLAVTEENCHNFVFRTVLVRKSEKKQKKKKNPKFCLHEKTQTHSLRIWEQGRLPGPWNSGCPWWPKDRAVVSA